MVEIKIYPKVDGPPVSVNCKACGKCIADKACVVIRFSGTHYNWYCIDCVIVKDFSQGKLICTK